MIVYCVLKTGGCYNRDYVKRLYQSVINNTSNKIRFICLTDSDDIDFCEVVPLKHNWLGWWSKIELFRPDLPKEPAVYFDLDTVILRRIDRLIEVAFGSFAVLEGFNQRVSAMKGNKNFASGIMAGDFYNYSKVYYEFREDPDKYISYSYNKGREGDWRHGDQAFIAMMLRCDSVKRIQDFLPGNFIVGKRILKKQGIIPQEARVIAWSGEPRLHELFTFSGNVGFPQKLYRDIDNQWRKYE